MGYYQSGDYYEGDPGMGSAIVRAGGGMLARRFFPAVGAAAATGLAVRGAKFIAKRALRGVIVGGRGRGRRPKRKYPYRDKAGRVHTHPPRMNPLNPRALRRSLRRAKRFERFARQVISITRPRGGRRFKFGRKRRRF